MAFQEGNCDKTRQGLVLSFQTGSFPTNRRWEKSAAISLELLPQSNHRVTIHPCFVRSAAKRLAAKFKRSRTIHDSKERSELIPGQVAHSRLPLDFPFYCSTPSDRRHLRLKTATSRKIFFRPEDRVMERDHDRRFLAASFRSDGIADGLGRRRPRRVGALDTVG